MFISWRCISSWFISGWFKNGRSVSVYFIRVYFKIVQCIKKFKLLDITMDGEAFELSPDRSGEGHKVANIEEKKEVD